MEEFKHRHTDDPFVDGIGEKLANHQMPVDPAVWKGIHQQLAPRKRLLPWWAIAGLSAAAAIALVITIGNWFFQPTEESLLAERQSVRESVETEQQQTATTKVLNQDSSASNLYNSPSGNTQKQVVAHKQMKESVITLAQNQIIDSESVELITITHEHIEVATIEPKQELEPKPESTVAEPTTTQTSLAHQLLLTDELPADWTDLLKEDKKGILLAAGVGSGIAGSNVSFGGNKMYADMSESLSKAPTAYAASLRPEDFYNKDYMPPLSAGLRIRKNISDNTSIETGLVYSYLQTKLSGTSFGTYVAEMNLHYLGIPLSLGTTLLENNKWELSFYMGGMLEKGLWSVFRQDEIFANSTITTEVSKKISGFQSSLHASLGLSYKLDKDIYLYLDPVLSYYFDNSQPFSIRTAMPLMLSLQAGLRFNF